MFLASPCLRYIDFQTDHFGNFKPFKVDGHPVTLGKSNLTPLDNFSEFWQVAVVSVSLDKTAKNSPTSLYLIKW